MHGGNDRWARGGLVLVGLLTAAGCAVELETGDNEAPRDELTATATAVPPSEYDFRCHDAPAPDKAMNPVLLSGFANDSYTGGPLPGVTVDLIATGDDRVLATTSSDSGGGLRFEIATDFEPITQYSRMIRPGHVDSYLYPSGPLWQDEINRAHPVIPPTWRDELAGHAGVTLDPGKGIVAVIVTDCAGERVEGAIVTFDPPADAVAYWDLTFTEASSTQTTLNGHAWGFNVPAGEVHATVSFGGLTYRDWPVKSFADSRTMSWRAP